MNDPTPPKRSRFAGYPSSKAILLWVAIVAWMSALPFCGSLTGSAPAPRLADYLAQMAPTWFLLVPVVGLFVFLRRFAARNQRGVDLMIAGDLTGAAEVFRKLSRAPIGFGSVPRYNLGLTLLRLGDVRGAIDALAHVRGLGARRIRAAALSTLSFCHAVVGDAARAAELAAAARGASSLQAAFMRLHLAAEAILALRGGDAAGAVRRFEEGWRELEICTSADLVRALRVIRAYALESAGGGAASVHELLAGARPCRPGEYAWLGADWPELARFLDANGFAAAA